MFKISDTIRNLDDSDISDNLLYYDYQTKHLLSLIKKGLVPEGIDYQTMTSLFNAGKIGMILTGPWAVGGAEKSGINVGVAKIPTVDGNTPRPFVGVQGFMMSNFSKNKALAAFFLKDYVATKDTMLALYKADPRAPAFKPALTAVAQDGTSFPNPSISTTQILHEATLFTNFNSPRSI